MSGLIDQLLSLWPSFLSSAGVGSFLYWLLKRKIEDRFTRELEKAKHELQLEQQRMSVVFEHQKDSFNKVLTEMHGALQAIEDKVEPDGGPWFPILAEKQMEFRRLVSGECLFLDADACHAVDLFSSSMWDAVEDGSYQQYPKSFEVRRAYEKMVLISDRLAEHFRSRVGLTPTNPLPLFDVEVLGACVLINRYTFQSYSFPTKGTLQWREGETAEEMVGIGVQHADQLKSELLRLKQAMGTDQQRTSLFYNTLRETDRYLKKLDERRTKAESSAAHV